MVDSGKGGGFNPKWSLLINEPGARGSSNKSAADEGDVGSTRQTNPSQRTESRQLPTGDVKKNWIKVRYQRVTKRICNAPKDIEELKIFLWNRFGELRDTFPDPGTLFI